MMKHSTHILYPEGHCIVNMTLLFIAFLLSSTAHVAGGQMQHTDLPANEWKTREQDTSDTVDDGDVNPTGWVYGIHQIIDSLQQLNSTQALSKKQEMQIYTQIADKYHTIETDSSIAYRIKTITLARELNDFEELMKAYYSMAIDHIFKGNFDTAFDYLKQANDLALKHRNKEMEAAVLNSTGYAYMKQGKYNMAIDYYLKYLKMSENEGWTYNCIRALANLGEINRRLGNTEQSFQYLKQAEEINNQLYPVSSDWLMPHIYNEYAFNYLNLGDYDEALHHALKADSIVLPFGTINRCYTKGILASIYLHRNDYERALQNAQESFEQANILKAANLYINAGKILSDIYLAQKRYREAETEAIKAWQIDTTNIDESRALIHNIALANIYMGNKEKAAYYLNKYSELNARYTEKSFHTTASDLSISYETGKKETRIASLEKERRLYIWLGIAGGMVVVALAVMYRLSVRNARKGQLLVATQAVEEGGIGERARIAADLHDRLVGSLSAVKIGLKNAEGLPVISEKIDECMKEVREITNNIMPRSLRLFGLKGALEDLCAQFQNVQFHFFGEEKRFKHNLEYAIYCCARELVNNALAHSGASIINIQMVQSRKMVSLTVEDNGFGFDEKTVKKGDGLHNLRNRIASCGGKIDIASVPGKGTETVIQLKIDN